MQRTEKRSLFKLYLALLNIFIAFHTFLPFCSANNNASMNHRIDSFMVPGVVITHSPASSGKYIGSPNIIRLPNGLYLASHDFFGPSANHRSSPTTVIYQSKDQGKTWSKLANIRPLFWNKLFFHQNKIYSLGVEKEYGDILIRSSDDEGKTWTTPNKSTTGLLKKGLFHTAPCPVVFHNERIWRSIELAHGDRPEWSIMVMSAPIGADLLDSKYWTFSEPLSHLWSNSQWIEGNIVITPESALVNILRTNGQGVNKAVIAPISHDGKSLTHNSSKDTIDFPGGGVKFSINYDAQTSRYWSIANLQQPSAAARNHLVLTSSKDLRQWTIECTLFSHPDKYHHAWQYVDWLIEGKDIIFVSRTAYDDHSGGALNDHDANYLTFHRIKHFRNIEKRHMSI